MKGVVEGAHATRTPWKTMPSCVSRMTTPGGIPILPQVAPLVSRTVARDLSPLRLHLEHSRLNLLRGYDQLLCLDGITGVEHIPHQIETVRKVLRRFRGRVLLADEVGLGKTIEACLLLREYMLRGIVKRVLILVPTPLVSQWSDELKSKFALDFVVPPRTRTSNSAEFWAEHDRVLVSMNFAKMKSRAHSVAAAPWDLVIVDEAHHCKNRGTLNWKLVNSLQRRHLFLLTATPVQNDLLELYNLLTLLEPGHLKTESHFKKQYVRRGNPRDPRNRERLRSLMGEVMVRNTRSLVEMELPPRYAQTILAEPKGEEARLYRLLAGYLRSRQAIPAADDGSYVECGQDDAQEEKTACPYEGRAPADWTPLNRRQLAALLTSSGSHPRALGQSLRNITGDDPSAEQIVELAAGVRRSAKDEKLLELVRQSQGNKLLVFATSRRTLDHLQQLLAEERYAFSTYSGAQSSREKDEAVEAFRDSVPIMLCSESGGEGRNLQFANTLVNFDLPWNPMRIEQRIGRIHRIGQQREVFIFNLCTAGSLEARILDLLNEKIRMFELVVGEVGSILGNLQGGDEFESIVLNLWLQSHSDDDLVHAFDRLGESIMDAQREYLEAKQLDEALFGEDYNE